MNIAVLRIRGREGINREIQETMDLLHLHKKHYCTIVSGTPSIKGMLIKSKDYITWGTIDDSAKKALFEKRGEEYKGDPEKKRKYIEFEGKKYKPYIRMHPPRGGFERKGIKQPYKTGGVLGDRKNQMAQLLNKMM